MSEENQKDEAFEKALDEVVRDFNEYEHQRLVCLSMREYYTQGQTRAWCEPEIKPTTGDNKTPDLLLRHGDWIVLDYKEITSTKKDTLNAHIDDMNKYQQEFVFQSQTFDPDVAIICPMKTAGAFKGVVNTVPILGCKLDKEIRLKHIAGAFKSTAIRQFFTQEQVIPLATRTSTHKFLRHEPKCISYTAEIVRSALWQLNLSVGSDEIRVSKTDLIDVLETFYPPYLKNDRGFDIRQVTEGRVDQAIKFLLKFDFVEIEYEQKGTKQEEVIVTSRSKGRQVTNFLKYFQEKEARLRVAKQQKSERRRTRELERQRKKEEKLKAKLKGQESITKYFPKHSKIK